MIEGDRRRRLEELFDEHAAAVRAYALRRIDATSADDTVSEVFVVACRVTWHFVCHPACTRGQTRTLTPHDNIVAVRAPEPPERAAPSM